MLLSSVVGSLGSLTGVRGHKTNNDRKSMRLCRGDQHIEGGNVKTLRVSSPQIEKYCTYQFYKKQANIRF